MDAFDDGGAAFPRPAVFTEVLGLASPELDGMSLRDYFATNLPFDEFGQTSYSRLSRDAQELLVGRKYPEEPPKHVSGMYGNKSLAEFKLEEARFLCDVNAALRYMAADAMLARRKVR